MRIPVPHWKILQSTDQRRIPVISSSPPPLDIDRTDAPMNDYLLFCHTKNFKIASTDTNNSEFYIDHNPLFSISSNSMVIFD